MVFYRKYRPQIIDELDKKEIRKRLKAIFLGKKIPHAFLFSGPMGTGKTSAARITAKAINCLKLTQKLQDIIEPCNKCSNCKAISSGTHIDILEIDAASNRGIDEIRALRERVNLLPSTAKKKIYIIDEVHMLTREAFNALLKTLEEPPKHVIAILATTESYKLPDTIISRCVHLNFTKATDKEIIRSLKRVVEKEKLKVEDSTLKLIAKHADGSFRDAVKILEQAAVEKKLSKDQIAKFLGREALAPRELLKYLLIKDAKKALEFIQSKIKEGVELKFLTEEVLEELRSILIEKYSKEDVNSKSDFKKEDLKKLISLFVRAHQEMKTSYIEQLPLELVVIEWCERR